MNPFVYLVISATFLEAVADVLFKFWTLNNKISLLVVGIIIYTIGTGIWAYSLRFEFLSKAITIFTVLNLILVIIAGLILFGEHLSFYSKVGIVLGIVSVFLMLI